MLSKQYCTMLLLSIISIPDISINEAHVGLNLTLVKLHVLVVMVANSFSSIRF